jgi:hypothetical protein
VERFAAEPKVKGVAFRTIDLCFTELRGAAARDDARKLMLPELQHAFSYGTLLAASWYPISWYKDVFRCYRAVTGFGPELSKTIGNLAARHDMSNIYKQLFARLVSPQMLLSVTQRLFNTYYDTGKLIVTESRSGFAHMQCRSCVGWDENMWQELAGSAEAQLALAGAKNIRLRVIAGARDMDDSADFEARWT